MNTAMPPEWRPTPQDRPALLRNSTANRRRVSTSWRGCPLSCAWDGALARDDDRLLQSVDRVASEWNRVVCRGPLAWRWRTGRAPVRFSAEACAVVTAAVATAVLERTLGHIESLRRQPRPRCSLRAIALLELVETAVASELDERHAPAWRRRDLPGEVTRR
jgi:hypothetical protein